jgi:hypothetical protein
MMFAIGGNRREEVERKGEGTQELDVQEHVRGERRKEAELRPCNEATVFVCWYRLDCKQCFPKAHFSALQHCGSNKRLNTHTHTQKAGA